MPTVLNLCRRGKQTLLCSLLFLPFLGLYPYPAGDPCQGCKTGADTIGRKKDRHYKREVREWKRHESDIIGRYLQLVQLQKQLAAEGKREDQQAVLNERIRRLKTIVATLDLLRYDDSPYYYIIRKVPSTQGVGETVYDPCSQEVAFGIQDSDDGTYSLVHEVTHGLQFTRGEMVFDRCSGLSVGDDIGDELEAYRNQFAYDTASVSGIHTFAEIDSTWLRSLRDRDGVYLYSPYITGKYNVIGLRTVTVDSDTVALREAYPAIKAWGYYPFPLKDASHFIFRDGRKTSR
jgi:hypothetical protein